MALRIASAFKCSLLQWMGTLDAMYWNALLKTRNINDTPEINARPQEKCGLLTRLKYWFVSIVDTRLSFPLILAARRGRLSTFTRCLLAARAAQSSEFLVEKQHTVRAIGKSMELANNRIKSWTCGSWIVVHVIPIQYTNIARSNASQSTGFFWTYTAVFACFSRFSISHRKFCNHSFLVSAFVLFGLFVC